MGNGLIQVVAGAHVTIIENVPFILLGLKPSGIWEFPGGKVNNNETHFTGNGARMDRGIGCGWWNVKTNDLVMPETDNLRYGSMR